MTFPVLRETIVFLCEELATLGVFFGSTRIKSELEYPIEPVEQVLRCGPFACLA